MGIFSRLTLPSVKPSEAMDMLSAGETMLDVRDNSEWNAGRVPGAVRVLAANVAALEPNRLPKGRPVVVAGRTGSPTRYFHCTGRQHHLAGIFWETRAR